MDTRAYRGAALLVLALFFTGFLLSCGMPEQTGSAGKPSSPASRATNSTASTVEVRVLPTPSARPVNAAATNEYSTNLVIASDVAYVGTVNNAFYALRASDGALLWHTKIDGSVEEPPVVTDGVVYFSTFVGQAGPANVYALRASDGAQLWEYHGNYTYVSTPVVANGLVYLNASNGVVALHANNGTQAWHFAAGDNTSIATVVNGILYLSSHQGDSGPGTAYALHADDGSLLWQYKSSKTLDPPEVINGVAYVGAWDGTLFALRASDGSLLWHAALSGPSLWMQRANDVLYVATQKITYPTASNATAPVEALAVNSFLQAIAPLSRTMPHKQILTDLYALRVSDGTTLWRNELNNGTDSFASYFVVDNGIIYGTENVNTNLTNHNYVYAMRGSDSKLLWQDETDVSSGTAQLANGVIYVTSGNSLQDQTTLYALRESDGSLLWNYPIAATSTNAPILVGNILYVGAENGMVYALSASNGKLLWYYQTNVNP
ncbi:MAG TPA: PQQ-binding-like beta-propeller repeat protein [Ktedonobacteraceae bacterium]|nr:PQQ-binding-like beta-propeller repeat protein [Ktedonobacteraceae bacterium]